MNKELYISTINFTNVFNKTQNLYSNYIDYIQKESRPLPESTFDKIKEVARKKVLVIKQLKDRVAKLAGFIPPDNYKKIMSAIENEEALSSMLESDATKFLETKDSKYEESVLSGLEYEMENRVELDQALSLLDQQMETSLVGAALSGRFSLEDITEIANFLEKDNPLQTRIEDLKNYLQNTHAKEKTEQQVKTEAEQEQSIGSDLKSPPILQSTRAQLQPLKGMGGADYKPEPPTLSDKISMVTYSKDKNIVAEVQELTIEDRMAQISEAISKLAGKEKLSLQEMIQVHQLQAEQVELEAYVESLNNQKLSRSEVKRNKKMQKATEKLQENRVLLEHSRENSKEYNSKIMRFISARYQERLEDQIIALYHKRGVVQDKQKASAIARYNRKSGRIVAKSKVVGLTKAVKGYATTKIEELKALRDQVVREANTLGSDIRRFVSSKEIISRLQHKNVVQLDSNISIEEHQRMMEQAKRA